MDFGLAGRRCLVTGASTGIGRATALALAAEGARVAVVARSAERLAEVAGRLPDPVAIAADLTAPDGPARVAAEALAGLGGVDVLVNNAGGSRPLKGEADDAFWDEAMLLNFTQARRLTEALLPGMRAAGWGRIVNITGAVAQRSVNAASPAKAALLSWSRGLACDVAKAGITVNCIAPGRIHSEQLRTRLFPTPEAERAEVERWIPMGRFGEPEELAALICFLASGQAGYITGASIPVDGGMFRLDSK